MAHFENGAFAFHQLLELRERKLAVGIESVPNGTRHLAYVFLDGNSHPCYIISIEPDDYHCSRENEQAEAALVFLGLCDQPKS